MLPAGGSRKARETSFRAGDADDITLSVSDCEMELTVALKAIRGEIRASYGGEEAWESSEEASWACAGSALQGST